MPLYVPDPDNLADAADLIEELGAELASRYAAAEDELIQQIARRAWRDMQLQGVLQQATLTAEQTNALVDRIAQNRAYAELAAFRSLTVRELQFLAIEVADKLRRYGLAESVMRIAATEGEAAAAAQLRMAKRLPLIGTTNATQSQAVTALVFDLKSRLEAMNWRITRYPQDAYQRVVSMTASNQLLGTTTGRIAQQRAVQRFLGEGITGFVDKAGRNWRIGSYAEMAGRTAVRRAYDEAGIWRMQQSGVNLVTVVGSLAACSKCAPWIGKTLSTDGTPAGDIILPSAVSDSAVTVHVDGTLDQAKASGWNHPNCTCRTVAKLAGLPGVQSTFKYNPQLEQERADQRALEREIRAVKRAASVAPDDITRKQAENKVKELQGEMRGFLQRTGRSRSSYREQLHFADGK